MNIEIITTGDEIMSGITLDTNFSWLAERLTSQGFSLRYHTSVGDSPEAIARALQTAAQRSAAVIVTGGLGPTSDDITASVAASFFDAPLELSAAALSMMERRFRSQGRALLQINKKQAYLPQGSKILENHWGTAAGFQYEHGGAQFFFLPGVPKEFRAMADEYVVPELEARDAGRKRYANRLVKTFGLRESEVADKIKDVHRHGVVIGYRAHFPQIHLRVSAYADSEAESEALAAGVVGEIEAILGDFIFTTRGENLEQVVGAMLRERDLTIAVAESCTGGLLADRITDVAASSDYFERGVVAYANSAKIDVLGVPEELLKSHGAVSAPVAEAMAEGVRVTSGADLGVAITGIAGPGGGTAQKPVGLVYIALSHAKLGSVSERFLFEGGRREIKILSSEAALSRIRKFLICGV
ncbi:MAG: competence/damage-inducible protein A [Deltaproteobacteria bacterium]